LVGDAEIGRLVEAAQQSAESVTWSGSAACGETLMATTGDAFTKTAAWAEAVRSALLVAVTWNVPGAAGAV
jgi:hypothetical protein